MRKFITTLIIATLCSCSAPERARETLYKAGFTDIETTGYQFLACGDDDTFTTGFVATNARGKRIEGVVCCGLIGKQCTIRF